MLVLMSICFTSCTTDDEPLELPTETTDCDYRYTTYYVDYDSQDNVMRINGVGNPWVQVTELGSYDGTAESIVPLNPWFAFKHQGWGVLSVKASDGFVIHTVNLFGNENGAYINANATSINTSLYTINYDGGDEYADNTDIYHLTITLRNE